MIALLYKQPLSCAYSPISKCIKYQTSLASTMELDTLLGFIEILGESLKNFLKHVKLMTFTTLLILSLHSLLMLANISYIKPLLNDLITNATSLQLATPDTPEFFSIVSVLREDLHLFAGLEWIFVVTIYVTSLFRAATTILASGVTPRGIEISIKVLLLRVVKLWKRPFITFFYLTLFELGYSFLTWATLIPFGADFSRSYYFICNHNFRSSCGFP